MRYTLNRILFCVLLHCLAIPTHAQPKQNRSALLVNDQALNFIVMGDWGRNGGDHQRQVAEQMGQTASVARVNFVITTGDNFYPRGAVTTEDPLWKFSFEDIYTDSSLHVDWYPVLGNHDYASKPDAQVAYTILSRRWSMPARYYSKKININYDSAKQILFAFIDTSPLVPQYYTGIGEAVQSQDSTKQKQWLEKILSDTSSCIKWKIVVGHHPMYTGGSRTADHDTRAIRKSLEPILKKYKVDAYLAGHEHSLQYIGPVDGVHHFISGAASERTRARMLPISKFAASKYGFMLFSATHQDMVVQVIDHRGKILYTTMIKK
jgi:tartrate-resistant acid phosphatase type 5